MTTDAPDRAGGGPARPRKAFGAAALKRAANGGFSDSPTAGAAKRGDRDPDDNVVVLDDDQEDEASDRDDPTWEGSPALGGARAAATRKDVVFQSVFRAKAGDEGGGDAGKERAVVDVDVDGDVDGDGVPDGRRRSRGRASDMDDGPARLDTQSRWSRKAKKETMEKGNTEKVSFDPRGSSKPGVRRRPARAKNKSKKELEVDRSLAQLNNMRALSQQKLLDESKVRGEHVRGLDSKGIGRFSTICDLTETTVADCRKRYEAKAAGAVSTRETPATDVVSVADSDSHPSMTPPKNVTVSGTVSGILGAPGTQHLRDPDSVQVGREGTPLVEGGQREVDCAGGNGLRKSVFPPHNAAHAETGPSFVSQLCNEQNAGSSACQPGLGLSANSAHKRLTRSASQNRCGDGHEEPSIDDPHQNRSESAAELESQWERNKVTLDIASTTGEERRLELEARSKQVALEDLEKLPVRVLLRFPSKEWHPRDRVEVTTDDKARLQRGCYLNDSIVDFFMKFMEHVMAPEFLPGTCPLFVFSSFFYGRLGCSSPIDYAGVQRWTNNAEDLFSKRHVFIPICDSHHWSLIIIVNLQSVESLMHQWEAEKEVDRDGSECPTLLYLDSLSPQRGTDFMNNVQSYLAEEWLFRKVQRGNHGVSVSEAKRKSVKEGFRRMFKNLKPKPPQQKNEYDCGLYLLRSVLNFLRNTDGFRQRCLASKGCSPKPNLDTAYHEGDILELREYVKQAIDNLTEVDVARQVSQDETERDSRVREYHSNCQHGSEESVVGKVQCAHLNETSGAEVTEGDSVAGALEALPTSAGNDGDAVSVFSVDSDGEKIEEDPSSLRESGGQERDVESSIHAYNGRSMPDEAAATMFQSEADPRPFGAMSSKHMTNSPQSRDMLQDDVGHHLAGHEYHYTNTYVPVASPLRSDEGVGVGLEPAAGDGVGLEPAADVGVAAGVGVGLEPAVGVGVGLESASGCGVVYTQQNCHVGTTEQFLTPLCARGGESTQDIPSVQHPLDGIRNPPLHYSQSGIEKPSAHHPKHGIEVPSEVPKPLAPFDVLAKFDRRISSTVPQLMGTANGHQAMKMDVDSIPAPNVLGDPVAAESPAAIMQTEADYCDSEAAPMDSDSPNGGVSPMGQRSTPDRMDDISGASPEVPRSRRLACGHRPATCFVAGSMGVPHSIDDHNCVMKQIVQDVIDLDKSDGEPSGVPMDAVHDDDRSDMADSDV